LWGEDVPKVKLGEKPADALFVLITGSARAKGKDAGALAKAMGVSLNTCYTRLRSKSTDGWSLGEIYAAAKCCGIGIDELRQAISYNR